MQVSEHVGAEGGRQKGEFWHQHQVHSFVVLILYTTLADRDTFAEQQSNKYADQNKLESNRKAAVLLVL